MTSPGDSGAGWFANIDGQMQLVGINNGAWGEYGWGDSLALRTSLYNDWITETMGSTAVPEPSTLVLFASGALGSLPFLRCQGKRKRAA